MSGKRIYLEEVLEAYSKTGIMPSVDDIDFRHACAISALWFARHKIPTTRKSKDGKEVALRKQETQTVVYCLINKWADERYGDIIESNGIKYNVSPYVSGFIGGWTNCIVRRKNDEYCIPTPQNQLERFQQGLGDGARISSHIFSYRI